MKSILAIFRRGLKKTAVSISRTLAGVFSGTKAWAESDYETLEAALLGADFGIAVTTRLVTDIRERYRQGLIKTNEEIVRIAKEDILGILARHVRPIRLQEKSLTVIVFVGVNGSGKTTTAGKLAHHWSNEGKNVVLAACDTFRAAAVEQLKLWGERTNCHVVSARQGADPSAVAYDAVESALARKADILLIDTAGRQHTRKGLMDELSKMRRSIDKAYPGSPHEVWLTIDTSMGSNVLAQAREFKAAADISGLILTKLDGTGRGGMAVAIQEEFPVPVFFVGFGEQPEDLQPFDPEFYADGLFQ
jgi:fused signal recognition particle receptor